ESCRRRYRPSRRSCRRTDPAGHGLRCAARAPRSRRCPGRCPARDCASARPCRPCPAADCRARGAAPAGLARIAAAQRILGIAHRAFGAAQRLRHLHAVLIELAHEIAQLVAQALLLAALLLAPLAVTGLLTLLALLALLPLLPALALLATLPLLLLLTALAL